MVYLNWAWGRLIVQARFLSFGDLRVEIHLFFVRDSVGLGLGWDYALNPPWEIGTVCLDGAVPCLIHPPSRPPSPLGTDGRPRGASPGSLPGRLRWHRSTSKARRTICFGKSFSPSILDNLISSFA